MKPSKYNYFVKNGDKIICFNGNTGMAISTNKNEYEIIKSIIDGKTTDKLSLHQWLIKNGFIIDDNRDELDIIRLRNRQSVFSNNFHLSINPTLECNFNCWYCYEDHVQGRMTAETVNNIKNYAKDLVNKKMINGFLLGWFGGEPLRYFDEVMYPIASYIKTLCKTNGLAYSQNITTNGYYITRPMIEKFDETDLRHFQITLDGDEESHNKTRNCKGEPSFNIIITNIINLLKYLPKANILLRINYTNEIIKKDFKEILQVIPVDYRKKVHVHFQRVWQTYKEVDSDGLDNVWLIKWLDELHNMGFYVHPDNAYFPGKSVVCYADRFNYANINYDGKVYKCTARDFNEENSVGILTDKGIQWKTPKLERLYAKANYENEKCLKCKNLAICGGPCPQQMQDYKEGKISNFCTGGKKELTVKRFVIEHHRALVRYNDCLSKAKALVS